MEREGEEDLRGVVRREILIRICKGKIEKPSILINMRIQKIWDLNESKCGLKNKTNF